jgi:hypothetical protein
VAIEDISTSIAFMSSIKHQPSCNPSKSNFRFVRLYSRSTDKLTRVQSDQIIVLEGFYSFKVYPDKPGRIGHSDTDQNKRVIFLTNDFTPPALSIAELFRYRWQIELFFKWTKQHLRVKPFYGTTRECGQYPDLGYNYCLRDAGHSQKADALRREPLHNSTDSERYSFRKSARFRGSLSHSTSRIGEHILQPMDFIRLILEQC